MRTLDLSLITQPSRHMSRRRRSTPSALKAFTLLVLFLLFSALLTSCQTAKPAVSGVMLSYNSLKTILGNHMPGGIREQSSNGRKLYTGFFSPRNFDEDASEASDRAYGIVTILGSSRPYNVDVEVVREKKSGGDYRSEGRDKALTKKLTERLRQALADRREDRNVIDDFRAF
jgi:hypothetical protein